MLVCLLRDFISMAKIFLDRPLKELVELLEIDKFILEFLLYYEV